mgnify:CR=1 FL=1
MAEPDCNDGNLDAMKIILEPTNTDGEGLRKRPIITLEMDGDYLRADLFFDLIASACVAYGWHPEAVAKRINTEKETSCELHMKYPKMP